MRNAKVTLGGLLWCAALASGCSGGTSHPGAGTKLAGTGGAHAKAGTTGHMADASIEDAGAATVMLSGTLTDFKTKAAIEGATMCLTTPAEDPMPCATTAASGQYSLAIPADADVAVAFRADGFFDQLVLERVSHDVQLDLEPVSTEDLKMQAASVGVTLQDGEGALALNASIPGISFRVSPEAGTIVYYDSSGQPSASATKTSTPGLGVIFGLTPGRYEIMYDGASQGCVIADLGWPGSAPSQARAVVVANSISEIGMTCL